MLLVERGHVELGPEELELLVERTEGWPAALVLAGLWLRAVEDPDRAVRDFGGDQRFVADYLSREVFASLGDEQRSFLQAASVLGRFTSELCDGVLDRSDSATMLAELARTNMLILPLERGGWFRVHSLFAEYAAAELASLDPAAGTRIHRRAAGGSDRTAFRPRRRSTLRRQATTSSWRSCSSSTTCRLIRSGATRTLLRRVRALPEERLVEHPELAAAAATAALMAGQSTMELRRFLSLVDRARALTPRGLEPVRRRGGAHGARGHDGWRRAAGGPRRPTCRRARAGERGRAPHRRPHGLRTRALLRRRPRRRVEGRAPGARASRRQASSAQPGARPHDARPRRGRARAGSSPPATTPSRRRRSSAGSGPAGAGSARTPRPPSAPCWRRRASSQMRSAS